MSVSERFRFAEEERATRKKRAPWGVIALVLLTGLALIRNGSGEFDVGPPQPATAAAPDPSSAPSPSAASAAPQLVLSRSVPDRIRIPVIQVDAPITPVGVDEDGWIAAPPPENPNLAGWFTGAVTPGEKGTAIIDGHVDNAAGPAVFYGLGAVQKGNRVEVHRQDGKTAVFEVYGVEVFKKENFPGDRVYGSKGTPELRVITCGGGYNEATGYQGNVVVFARLVGVR
ncbi:MULTISPECIES: class F sortase [Streptomyces]|uniref:Class F sortase n=1 Tax=Streptomyces thermogriseus TaxID=75292 RepID=A0ABP4DBY2_9ACTN|nr:MULTISPECIES: class F sortase [Streptomyces]MDN5383850.1 class F sortase [Streptomyces sp. LB8]